MANTSDINSGYKITLGTILICLNIFKNIIFVTNFGNFSFHNFLRSHLLKVRCLMIPPDNSYRNVFHDY